jgi:glycine/D-amino acid oxidase-like deaminating enzyme/nitrite reductase/ring-hydroxylating ferredoxin subunit
MATEHYFSQAIWSASAKPSNYPQLPGDMEVDVAIVGGGITGISAAYLLAKQGKKVAVLEAKGVGMGTTGSSTGNLYASTDEHLHKIASKHNEETMKAVAASRLAALDFIEERVRAHDIDCEFERVPWYLFTTQEDTSRNSEVENELEALKKAGLAATGETPVGFPFQVSAIANHQHQAQFNPLKYVKQLAAAAAGENCHIFENTKATKIEDGSPCVVHTPSGKVRAKKVIQATHSPKGIYAVHTTMEVYREYALAVRLKSNTPAGGVYWHLTKSQMYSVRPYSNEQGSFLLVLDASHKLGHVKQTEESFKKVEEYLRAHFDVDKVEYTWAAQNYKAADKIPFIGTSPMEDNIYIATGFAADGLIYGTLAAMIISEAIAGKENKWAKIYDPKRFTPAASAGRFAKENIDVATHLIKDYLFKGTEKELEAVKAGEGKIVEIDDKKLAAYRDEQGKLHLVSPVCTHLGCMVHWNGGEKSWDCPCHGSRFSVDGEVLEGPAFNALAKPKEAKKGEQQ